MNFAGRGGREYGAEGGLGWTDVWGGREAVHTGTPSDTHNTSLAPSSYDSDISQPAGRRRHLLYCRFPLSHPTLPHV
jgi:hypothetical protein